MNRMPRAGQGSHYVILNPIVMNLRYLASRSDVGVQCGRWSGLRPYASCCGSHSQAARRHQWNHRRCDDNAGCDLGRDPCGPMLLSPDATSGERIAFALSGDAIIALWLGISIALLARHRFYSPEDIDGGGLTHGSEKANILQATLAEHAGTVGSGSASAFVVGNSDARVWISVIPAAVVLFLCGRVLFVRGYRGGAPTRALGFALTFCPSVLMLVFVVGAQYRRDSSS